MDENAERLAIGAVAVVVRLVAGGMEPERAERAIVEQKILEALELDEPPDVIASKILEAQERGIAETFVQQSEARRASRPNPLRRPAPEGP